MSRLEPYRGLALGSLTMALSLSMSTPAIAESTHAENTLAESSASEDSVSIQHNTVTQADRMAHYQLSSGPLGQRLNQLAAQHGLALSYDPSLTQGLQSAPLEGRYTPRQAMAQLLRHTDLQLVDHHDGTFSLKTVPNTSPQNLDTMTVTGSRTPARYTAESTSAATKMSLSMRETPQAVSVITQQQLEDQGLDNIEDALLTTPGITLTKAGSSRPTFYARGFSVSNISYDNVPTSISNFAFGLIDGVDTAVFDRVEIVRGASGLMQGTGNPSAYINLVRKRPTHEFQGYVQGQAGRWDNQRGELDISGPLTAGGQVRGRLVAAYQDHDSFMEDMGERKRVFYGILEADLTPQTLLSLSVTQQKTDRDNSWGLQPYGLSRSSNLSPEWAYNDTDNRFYSLELSHHFSNDWKIQFSANHITSDADFVGTYYAGDLDLSTGDGLSIYDGSIYHNDEKQTGLDLFATGGFTLAGQAHELLVGIDHRWRDFTPWGQYGLASHPINVYTWDNSTLPAPERGKLSRGNWDYHDKQSSVYATARWHLSDPLSLITGARVTDWDYEQHTGTSHYEVDHEITPFIGAIYDLNAQYSLYGSYTSIFEPQNAYDINGDLLDPIEGHSYEVGIKGEFNDGLLNATLALYRIDQVNRAQTDYDGPSPCPGNPTSTYCSEDSGKVRSQGIELELSGQLTPATQASFGYTFNRNQYEKDAENKGDTFNTQLPKHLLRLSLRHELNAQWVVGGSLQAQSRIYEGSASRTVEQSGYYVANLMAGWAPTEQLSFRVNLNNLFDREYYEALGSANSLNAYGNPRNLLLTARYEL
ncbi:hypothetical protein BFW38_05335 [Terasakiispira papahanaumokuakeensis]|uniref:Secretin/TonB short N-terminal domain-containing protein n=1 Tax=Terasakiispira papahanaumokuakeensis TaxID=197479 RepID=A0A1E2V8S0_9GAMM|nr:TonB-dependent receptor [Terasakiispira papahanaumokuakeensis]ODC03055.1 hypothetical protein BFW38_05335 [Terasakiispira papahanaumokuakeensis]